jgi:oxaloacetate decarboxylase alpha subunit
VAAPPVGNARNVPAPLAGNIFKINVAVGQAVKSGDIVMILEAMKMETEVRAPESGKVQAVLVKEGDAVQVGDVLLSLS